MTARSLSWLLCLPGLFLLGGCRGGPAEVTITDEYFFHGPPGMPRVQYLRSFNGSRDFEARHRLLDYLAGEDELVEYEIMKAFSVATTRGRIYVTDSFGLKGVNVFDLENRRFYVLGTQDPGRLKKPIHVFADEAGFKYVSDLQRKQIVVYGPDDAFVRAYGDGESFLPVSCVTYGNEVYILDMTKDKVEFEDVDGEEAYDEVRRDQILVLDKETGKGLRRIGQHGTGHEGFSFASFLAVDRLGDLYVSDFLNCRVVKLDPQGNVLAAFGRRGDGPGDFAQMKGVAVDRRGFIYVVDAAFQAAQIFDNSGKAVFAFGGPRAPKGHMDLPAGIWIDYQNLDYFRDLYGPGFVPEYLIVVANQLSPTHRVSVYAYGKRKGLEYPAEDDLVTLDSAAKEPLWRMPVFPAEVAPDTGDRSAAAPRNVGSSPR